MILNMGFTNISEIDLKILCFLNIETLEKIKHINVYMKNLYDNEYLWNFLIKRDYNNYINGKSNEESWKEYYFFLKHSFNEQNSIDMYKVIKYQKHNLFKLILKTHLQKFAYNKNERINCIKFFSKLFFFFTFIFLFFILF